MGSLLGSEDKVGVVLPSTVGVIEILGELLGNPVGFDDGDLLGSSLGAADNEGVVLP